MSCRWAVGYFSILFQDKHHCDSTTLQCKAKCKSLLSTPPYLIKHAIQRCVQYSWQLATNFANFYIVYCNMLLTSPRHTSTQLITTHQPTMSSHPQQECVSGHNTIEIAPYSKNSCVCVCLDNLDKQLFSSTVYLCIHSLIYLRIQWTTRRCRKFLIQSLSAWCGDSVGLLVYSHPWCLCGPRPSRDSTGSSL